MSQHKIMLRSFLKTYPAVWSLIFPLVQWLEHFVGKWRTRFQCWCIPSHEYSGPPRVLCGHPAGRVTPFFLLKWNISWERKVQTASVKERCSKITREWEHKTVSSSGTRRVRSYPWKFLVREVHVPFSQQSVPTSAGSLHLPCGTTNATKTACQMQSSMEFLMPGVSASLFRAPHTNGKLLISCLMQFFTSSFMPCVHSSCFNYGRRTNWACQLFFPPTSLSSSLLLQVFSPLLKAAIAC